MVTVFLKWPLQEAFTAIQQVTWPCNEVALFLAAIIEISLWMLDNILPVCCQQHFPSQGPQSTLLCIFAKWLHHSWIGECSILRNWVEICWPPSRMQKLLCFLEHVSSQSPSIKPNLQLAHQLIHANFQVWSWIYTLTCPVVSKRSSKIDEPMYYRYFWKV